MTPVERLDVSVYEIPLDAPESDGTFTWSSTTVVVVEPTAGGVTGLGFTYGTPACASVIHDVLEPVVTGTDALDPPAAWRAMVESIRNIGRPGVASMAIAAVDIALWDLDARLHDLPLCRLLGMARPDVPVYGSGGFTSMSLREVTEQLGRWVQEEGIPRVKMKIGRHHGDEPTRDLARILAVRQAIGPGAELFVDANGAYTAKQAVRLATRFGPATVTWFEEPVSSDDLDGLSRVRAAIEADVAAGEYGYDLVYFERMTGAGAVDVLQADVSRCAGITEWRRAAAVAAAHGLDISGHTAPSLHLHVACTVPNLRHVEWFADHVAVDALLFDGVVTPHHGVLRPDLDRPGIGLDLRRSDAARFSRA